MKRLIVALALFVCLPSVSFAQETYMEMDAGTDDFPIPGCGSTLHRQNVSTQFGPGPWLQYLVETTVDANVCAFVVSVDAFVQGIPNSASAKVGVFDATVIRQIPVPYYGTWTTIGFHSSATAIPGVVLRGASVSSAEIKPADFRVIRREEECVGTWDSATDHCIWMNCPIVINMDRHGYHMTSAAEGVAFDLNADGAFERVAWTHQDSNDAFLALDRNGNGRIDDGSELFGDHTPAYADRGDVTTANGFEALRFTQGWSYGYGTQDEVIDARDPVWSKLLLWTDRNHNGVSEPDELARVADSGLISIALTYKTIKRVDQFGNQFRQRADVTWRDGKTSSIFDVWLASVR